MSFSSQFLFFTGCDACFLKKTKEFSTLDCTGYLACMKSLKSLFACTKPRTLWISPVKEIKLSGTLALASYMATLLLLLLFLDCVSEVASAFILFATSRLLAFCANFKPSRNFFRLPVSCRSIKPGMVEDLDIVLVLLLDW